MSSSWVWSVSACGYWTNDRHEPCGMCDVCKARKGDNMIERHTKPHPAIDSWNDLAAEIKSLQEDLEHWKERARLAENARVDLVVERLKLQGELEKVQKMYRRLLLRVTL